MKRIFFLFFLVLVSPYTKAMETFSQTVIVKDQNGQLLNDAVVYAIPYSKTHTKETKKLLTAKMLQQGQIFIPAVLPVQVGTTVFFPNKDTTKHSVYSLSSSKKFNIPLYSKKKPNIKFEKPGIIVIGCNIHDWMIGYVYVVDTPYFEKSVQGVVTFKDLPKVPMDLFAWHPDIRRNKPHKKPINLASGVQSINFTLNLKKKRSHK